MEDLIKFKAPKNQSSIIKVIGVGGGGNNAVNHMFNQGINGVDFIVCNTDKQALEMSPVPNKVHLGRKGLGAGSVPAVGMKAAEEKKEEIKEMLSSGTEMLFITAGMGGGTGTGAAPVIAQIAKEVELEDEDVPNILTVAIVTIPFSFEGRKRRLQALEGINELRKYCDAVLVICNDKLRELYGDLPLSRAFAQADNILLTAAKGIAEIITVKAYVNIDFKDVNTVMKNSGAAIMGTGVAEGDDRAKKAIEMALTSPLLNDNEIKGTSDILLYLSSGSLEISMDEITEVTEFIINEAGSDVEIIWGVGNDESLGEKISVTVVATGFDKKDLNSEAKKKDQIIFDISGKIIHGELTAEKEKEQSKSEEIRLLSKSKKVEGPPQEEEHSDERESEDMRAYTADSEMKEKVKKHPEKGAAMVGELFSSDELPPVSRKQSGTSTTDDMIESKARERIQHLKDLSMKLKSPAGLSELENEPAYIRRKIKLSESKPSSDKVISRYSLSENDDNEIELKSDNPYLHDNVD